MGIRHNITIGSKTFGSKAKAIEFYQKILHSYSAKEPLSDVDFNNLIDLFNYSLKENNAQTEETTIKVESNDDSSISSVDEADELIVDDIIVDYHPTYRSTKCFYFVIDQHYELFSYRLSINGGLSDLKLFSVACRNAVKERLRSFKKNQFKFRPVRCAVSNEIVEWEKCQIDHKAPLTFSVIVKSFIVSKKISLSDIEYSCDDSIIEFIDRKLALEFDEFHKEMAVLRLLSTKENTKRASAARIKPSKKDSILK